MLINSDRQTAHLLVLNLSERGFNVISTINNKLALKIVEDHEVNLVVYDNLVDSNGEIDLIRQIRGIRPETKIILMTNSNEVITELQSNDCSSFDTVIKKPLTEFEVLYCIDRMI